MFLQIAGDLVRDRAHFFHFSGTNIWCLRCASTMLLHCGSYIACGLQTSLLWTSLDGEEAAISKALNAVLDPSGLLLLQVLRAAKAAGGER
jgi:hypothetical protein